VELGMKYVLLGLLMAALTNVNQSVETVLLLDLNNVMMEI
jgi:hypothetical protein